MSTQMPPAAHGDPLEASAVQRVVQQRGSGYISEEAPNTEEPMIPDPTESQDSLAPVTRAELHAELADVRENLAGIRAEMRHMATKAELVDIRESIAEMRAELRGTATKAELADTRAELKAEVANTRAELKAEMGELKATLTWRMVLVMGVMTALFGLIVKL